MEDLGLYTENPVPSQIKIGPVNYWPEKGTIFIDGYAKKERMKGLKALEQVLKAQGLIE